MKEVKNQEVKETTKEEKKKKISARVIVVLVAILVFACLSFISYRANYLNVISVGENYETIFNQKSENRTRIFGISAIAIFFYSLINTAFIKKGLKKFFEDEKKTFPKLPGKSISLILALIGGTIASIMLSDKYAIFVNAAEFGQVDPVFGTELEFYMFLLPFIQEMLIFLIGVMVVTLAYVGLYYVITLNTYFDGVDAEVLKKNTFIKHEMFLVVLLAIFVCAYVFIGAQNILTGTMLSIGEDIDVDLIGAGRADVTVKVWGYRIFSAVIFVAILKLLANVKKLDFKKGMLSILMVPAYLVCMFIVIVGFETVMVRTNEFDTEKEYIGYNIKYTKEAYGIDIEQQNVDDYKAVTLEQVNSNQDVINNIPVITEDVTLTTVGEHQENSVYYNYDRTALASYQVDGKNKLMYLTPREILTESAKSYKNRTYIYTHGYSLVASSANDSDGDGYAEYILSDYTSHKDALNITEPRIYFGLETDNTIVVNSDNGKEYDYPETPSVFAENVYDGKAGLKLDLLDRVVLGISQRDVKLATLDTNDNTKIITNRNVIERAKQILPDVLYDEEPYLVISAEGKLIWVLDGYTRSNAYPYSQRTEIDINGYREELNYIRNSVKVLIDAYDGTTTFYITDKTDPIIMTYRNIYPDLFSEEEIPSDIAAHFVYPKFLYNIQANIIDTYHDVSEDTLYRADDIWQISKKSATGAVAGVAMEPYYTTLKTIDSEKANLGLVVTYNKYGKQNICSYLVGTVTNGTPKLSLYKFKSENNVVGMIQLNNQIEQDETISKELEVLNTSGTKLIKDMIIVPINKSLLYIEPVYQVMLNESEIPVLKKVIVASGNTVAIGDTLETALVNLFSDANSVDLEFINTDNIEAIIDSVIRANQNLNESLQAHDFEMIGKDITRLQAVINQLQTVRERDLELQKEAQDDSEIVKDVTNTVTNEVVNEVTNQTRRSINKQNTVTNTSNSVR